MLPNRCTIIFLKYESRLRYTYKSGEWNVYSEIKHKLIEGYGIPAHEIRFIQECKTERSRKAVIEAMSSGDVRVLLCSVQA